MINVTWKRVYVEAVKKTVKVVVKTRTGRNKVQYLSSKR